METRTSPARPYDPYIAVTPYELIYIEARPPVSAEEVAMYGSHIPEGRQPGPRVLLTAVIFAAFAIAGMIELYFRMRP